MLLKPVRARVPNPPIPNEVMPGDSSTVTEDFRFAGKNALAENNHSQLLQ